MTAWASYQDKLARIVDSARSNEIGAVRTKIGDNALNYMQQNNLFPRADMPMLNEARLRTAAQQFFFYITSQLLAEMAEIANSDHTFGAYGEVKELLINGLSTLFKQKINTTQFQPNQCYLITLRELVINTIEKLQQTNSQLWSTNTILITAVLNEDPSTLANFYMWLLTSLNGV